MKKIIFGSLLFSSFMAFSSEKATIVSNDTYKSCHRENSTYSKTLFGRYLSEDGEVLVIKSNGEIELSNTISIISKRDHYSNYAFSFDDLFNNPNYRKSCYKLKDHKVNKFYSFFNGDSYFKSNFWDSSMNSFNDELVYVKDGTLDKVKGISLEIQVKARYSETHEHLDNLVTDSTLKESIFITKFNDSSDTDRIYVTSCRFTRKDFLDTWRQLRRQARRNGGQAQVRSGSGSKCNLIESLRHNRVKTFTRITDR